MSPSPLATRFFFFSSRRRHTRSLCDWSSDVCSSDLVSLSNARANSLGLQYNAPIVLKQITDTIKAFKNGTNPVNQAVAAIQGDVVAHSMGGVITRTMPLLTRFMSDPAFPTFNQGSIHKVVTSSAPHLGTPLANLLLDPTADCTREILASGGDFAFTSVTLSNSSVNGAVGDLQSGSQALNAIAQTGPHPLPTALVFGVYTNFASLDCTVNMFGIPCPACYIRSKCGSNGDVLGAKLNSTGWPLIFGSAGNNQNDAVVGQTS